LLVRKLWSSPSLRSSFLFGVGGIVFAIANIVLARALPEEEYGLAVLVYALCQIGIVLGPCGINIIVVRRGLSPDPHLLARVIPSSAVVAVGVALAGALLYPLGPVLLFAIAAGCLGGGVNSVAAAHYQSWHRFTTSLAVFQNQNGVLLLGAIACVVFDVRSAWLPCVVLALGLVLSGAISWTHLLRGTSAATKAQTFSWKEGLFLVGVPIVDLLLVQMERVLIPRVLTLSDLATYAILASLVGSPFRMLQLGVRYTILPRLTAARTVRERRDLLRRESVIAILMVAGGSVAVWIMTPLMARWFLAGKYDLTSALILAAIVSGVLRVVSALCTSVTVALGGARQLGQLNAASVGSLVIAVVAATVGAHWGIAGVIYGVAAGWLSRIVVAMVLAAPHLRQRDGEPPGRGPA